MGTLKDRFQYVWYGTCHDDHKPCRDLEFSDLSLADLSKIDSVSTLDDTGFVKYDPSSSSSSSLDRFACGKMYLVTLNHSAVTSGGVELPNALASSSMSKLQKYGISTTCNTTATPTPTPTPTPVACIPTSDFTTVPHHVGTQPVEGIGTLAFGDAGNFGFNPADFPDKQGLPRLYKIKDPDGFQVVSITADAYPNPGTEPMVYFDCTSSHCDGKCYGGKLKLIADSENWEANLSLL
jgi:hypothetical protein